MENRLEKTSSGFWGKRRRGLGGHRSFPVFCGMVLSKESPDGKKGKDRDLGLNSYFK